MTKSYATILRNGLWSCKYNFPIGNGLFVGGEWPLHILGSEQMAIEKACRIFNLTPDQIETQADRAGMAEIAGRAGDVVGKTITPGPPLTL